MAGKLNFMLQNSNSIFPLCRLKIFLAGFLEKFAFNVTTFIMQHLFQKNSWVDSTEIQKCLSVVEKYKRLFSYLLYLKLNEAFYESTPEWLSNLLAELSTKYISVL